MHDFSLEDSFLCRVTTAVAVAVFHAWYLFPLECIQAALSCSFLYVGQIVCCVKAIIADIACIIIFEVVRLFRQHQFTMHHGKPFPLVSAQKAQAALYGFRGSPSGCSAYLRYAGTL